MNINKILLSIIGLNMFAMNNGDENNNSSYVSTSTVVHDVNAIDRQYTVMPTTASVIATPAPAPTPSTLSRLAFFTQYCNTQEGRSTIDSACTQGTVVTGINYEDINCVDLENLCSFIINNNLQSSSVEDSIMKCLTSEHIFPRDRNGNIDIVSMITKESLLQLKGDFLICALVHLGIGGAQDNAAFLSDFSERMGFTYEEIIEIANKGDNGKDCLWDIICAARDFCTDPNNDAKLVDDKTQMYVRMYSHSQTRVQMFMVMNEGILSDTMLEFLQCLCSA